MILFFKDCFRRLRSSARHARAATTFTAASASDCSRECARSSRCASFSHRKYGSSSNNCVLSDLSGREIDERRDLIDDADWDAYEQLTGGDCGIGGGGGSGGGSGNNGGAC